MKFQYFLKIQDIKNVRWTKWTDLIVQTILFCLIPTALIFSREKQDWLLNLLAIQYVMGIWQMASSFISVLFKGPAFKKKLRHFLISGAYLLLLVTGVTLGAKTNYFNGGYEASPVILWICFFVPPWTLAIYYYSITWLLVNPRYKKLSSFLPHINF